ncbi:hypothetical protein HY024_02625 [Candidatus Curtissbacteria bacterium]|nr:hypothetical protein [Candidatus Curtissbacteria bacterium]
MAGEEKNPKGEQGAAKLQPLSEKLHTIDGEIKDLLPEGRAEANHQLSLAVDFTTHPTPTRLVRFIEPLLGRAPLPNLGTATSKSRQLGYNWTDNVAQDDSLKYYASENAEADTTRSILGNVAKGHHEELARLRSGKFRAIKHRGEIKDLDRQTEVVDGYIALFDEVVAPATEAVRDIQGVADSAIGSVIEYVAKKLPEDIVEQAAKTELADRITPSVVAEINAVWVDTKITPGLDKAFQAHLRKQRESDDYTDIDEQMEKANFMMLVDQYRQFVQTNTTQLPATTQDYEKFRANWEEQANSFQSQFSAMGVNVEYQLKGILGSIHRFSGQGQRERQYRPDDIPTPPEHQYVHLAKLIEQSLAADTREWAALYYDFPNTYDSPYNTRLSQIHDALRRLTSVRAGGVADLTVDDLNNLPLDRFETLKDFLVNEGLVEPEKVDKLEMKIVQLLVNKALLPGGSESWPGSGASGQLRALGSPKALEPLLYFQTYTAGARGLYPAGHTNAVVQSDLMTLLEKTDPATIDAQPIPQFAKDTLLLLKNMAGIDMDAYSASYRTAGFVAEKAEEAIAELLENYDNPTYRKWAAALLKGMRNAQNLYPAAYENIDALYERDSNLQQEILATLAFRIHNQEELGTIARINSDFPVAVEAMLKIMKSPDFKFTVENISSIYFAITGLQHSVTLADFTGADLAKLRIYFKSDGLDIGIPSGEQMNLAGHFQKELLDQLRDWMRDDKTPAVARYMMLQTFDYAEIDYPNLEDVVSLFGNADLEQQLSREHNLTSAYLKANFLKNTNRHGYYQCLTDLLATGYTKHNDRRAGQAIVDMYTQYPQARAAIAEELRDFHHKEDQQEYPGQYKELAGKFEKVMQETDDLELAKQIIEMFEQRAAMDVNTGAIEILLRNVDILTGEKHDDCFDALVNMAHQYQRFLGQPIKEDFEDDVKADWRNRQETFPKIAEKMWPYLDSGNLKEKYWATWVIYTNGDRGEKIREAVDELLADTHELENMYPGATHQLDLAKEDFEK